MERELPALLVIMVHRDTNETRSFPALIGIAIESHYSHASNVVNHEFLDYRCRFKATVVPQLKTFRTVREISCTFEIANDEYMLNKMHLCLFTAELKMDVLREREVKDSLERQLQDEQKVRGEKEIGGEREGLKKERADKTADPLGMFPLANWISMTDLHFHMGREQEGAESHQEVVTGKLIFERGRSPIDRRRRADRETFAPIDCPDSQSRNSESASLPGYQPQSSKRELSTERARFGWERSYAAVTSKAK
ncbi:hypothetical protein ALC60_03046 [Trachymyrmex zeteki]|uniref:Uncharacterized protein n=1 Tax=Mycetomoellerius zeteki TaxID=64791 RepID=A0A151XC76_9HYME|nr:hypothetical protein ALC60_03046 [Trachymyrmex zeteki]